MFQKKFRYMTALLAALMITQGSFTAFADETPLDRDTRTRIRPPRIPRQVIRQVHGKRSTVFT